MTTLVACVGSVDETAQVSSELMAGRRLTWTVSSTKPVTLDVCWENSSAAAPEAGETNGVSAATRLEWVRLVLKRNWERAARINFVGWDACTRSPTQGGSYGPKSPNSAGENIRVFITTNADCKVRPNDCGGQNPAHGSYGDGNEHSVRLNLHCDMSSATGLRACIEHLALHEFGHALGFYHEEERSDWPSSVACPKQTYDGTIAPWWPVPGEDKYGSPDARSVMAYCSGQSVGLSPTDVAGVQRLYQRHKPGTLMSANVGLCLDGGATPKVTHCTEPGWRQDWDYDLWDGSLSILEPIYHGVQEHCLGVNGITLQKQSCYGTAEQTWEFSNATLRGYGALCLNAVTRNGVTYAETGSCSGPQKWVVERIPYEDYVRFKTVSTSPKCLTAPNTTNTTALTLTTCSNSNTQKFSLGAGGQLKLRADSTKCVDVRDVWDSSFIAGSGGPTKGQAAQVFTCTASQLNQKWNIQTEVRSGTKCLARIGNLGNPERGATIYSCNGSDDQQWDYYW